MKLQDLGIKETVSQQLINQLTEDEGDPVHASYLVSMQKFSYPNNESKLEDTQFVRVDFRVPSWGVAHPQALRRQIDTHPKIKELHDNGYVNQKVVATWKDDPKAELADLERKLEDDRLLQSYRWEYEKRAKDLKAALDILAKHEVHENVKHVSEAGHGKVLTITQDGKKLVSVRLQPGVFHQIVSALRSHNDKIKTRDIEAVARKLKRDGSATVNDVEISFAEKGYREMGSVR